MSDPDSIRHERKSDALSILENLHRVARFMMLEHPLDAEERATVPPEVATVILAGHGAVKGISKWGTEYIVVDHGRRRTLRELPPDFSGDVIEARKVVIEARLRPELDTLASRLLELDPELYVQGGVQSILDALATYDDEESREVADLVLFTNSLRPGLGPILGRNSEDMRRWYEDSTESTGDAFLRMVLPGDVAAYHRAAAWLLASSPDPGLIIDLVMPGMRELTSDDSSDTKPTIPIMAPQWIIEALNVTSGEGYKISWHISRAMQRYASDALDQADKAEDFLEFHKLLHRAFLSYLTSQVLLKSVLVLDAHNSGRYAVDIPDVRRLKDISEEKRAIISSALLSSAVDQPFIPNITRLYRWEQWLAELRGRSLPAALDDIDNYYLHLILPERIRKVAEICTRLDHALANQQVLDFAMRAAATISLTPANTGSFPVQAASLGIRIARELRRMGSEEAALEWWRMSGPQAATLDGILSALEADPTSIPFSS
jgi:hypothetical protein